MSNPIEIVDVIHQYNAYSVQVMIVLSRMPDFVYERQGAALTAHDGGIYDFMYIGTPAAGLNAFGGREFDIALTDGTSLHCDGQVWSGRKGEAPEPLIDAAINTVAGLVECYVFMGCGGVSKAKYDAWMATHRPSYNYNKYDPCGTIEWLDSTQRADPGSDRPVCAKRARKLRQRGVTIRRNPQTGQLGWSPWYERRKADILRWRDPDYRGPHYDPARHDAARR